MDKNVLTAIEICKKNGINDSALEYEFLARAEIGLEKYGVTTERDDLSLGRWAVHALEEAMDHMIYCVKLCALMGDTAESIAVMAASVANLKASLVLCAKVYTDMPVEVI